ncbi:RNA-dependent RNA polymerase [Histoplasma capsulatum]|uniref:RNA-dependent RNA polymerase n=1 Tax=Ajellomyces capsulatus TaxID=5037 RepID=A0A8A1MBP3_AJECA|nr:RNA-dependent RNA polymerase [Histoplasma capsulatum]
MEIFCRNVPDQVQNNHLTRQFRPVLAPFGIHCFHCRKLPNRNAILTIGDLSKALKLLATYGRSSGPGRVRRPPRQQLRMFGQVIVIEQGRNTPDEFLLRSLKNEEETRLARGAISNNVQNHHQAPPVKRIKSFSITAMSCGMWDYHQGNPVFIECYRCGKNGKIAFGKTAVRVALETMQDVIYHLEFTYSNILGSIYTGTINAPSITITADTAPRLYKTDPTDVLAAGLHDMLQIQQKWMRKRPLKTRVGHFGDEHEALAGTCFVYRFLLKSSDDLVVVRDLANERHIPDIARWVDHRAKYDVPYSTLMQRFMAFLSQENMPYRVRFQLQKLVWNGDISPAKAISFASRVRATLVIEDLDIVVRALMRLSSDVKWPSPDVEASEVDVPALVEVFKNALESTAREREMTRSNRPMNPNHISIHRAQITPCGTYLDGPHAETKNRVLRHYSSHVDHFLRVEFVDETGDPVRYDPRASIDMIFESRFKTVLKSGINIAGRKFEFLGFSHSSLRSQTCWFVAPFYKDRILYNASTIIQNLGRFDHIQSPAKQAARIGQTFSDTLTSIPISDKYISIGKDVERNGRVFSDGVGTISPSVMYMIWKDHSLRSVVKPTVFQIRLAGAKGMISLDSRKKGKSLVLRPSMIKFHLPNSYNAFNIEICGSGLKPLPFFLNAQMIKILEDLGVDESVFLRLQADEISRLRATATSTAKAARFLEDTNIAKSVGLPWLINVLEGFGLRHSNDEFLRRVMELSVLIKLRDLKYRARIRVPNAVTLFGIMDETGILKEGEVFCTSLSDKGVREVLVNPRVVVTRSPAMHPGDVQIARAVDVPADSPLRQLHNCIAFSQHGHRDLPSMLSGGDLDGDLYNVIFDNTLLPKRIARPAEYPRVQEKVLGRTVVREDIIDFFVTFMQQDQLGRIATIHQALADQRPLGTFDPECLLLAELHSTAVDFSKTGVPVDLARIPKFPSCRPDFQAPSPRIRIAENLSLLEGDMDAVQDGGDEDDDERPAVRFYKSENILGKLYRSIDEVKFLQHRQSVMELPSAMCAPSVLRGVWEFVQREAEGFLWDHHIEHALDIRQIYEDNLLEIMARFSSTPWKSSITEYEVFVGTILGHGQKLSQRQKDSSKQMREEYEDLVQFVTALIQDREAGGVESLERSIACLYIAVEEEKKDNHSSRTAFGPKHDSSVARHYHKLKQQHQDQLGHGYGADKQGRKHRLLSFPWIAAIVCLKEVDKLQRTMPF